MRSEVYQLPQNILNQSEEKECPIVVGVIGYTKFIKTHELFKRENSQQK